MIEPAHLGPGSELPGWLEALETTVFGSAWGEVEEDDHLWVLPPCGFARWLVIPFAEEAELIRLAVVPEARRAGHGQALLRHSVAMLTDMGVKTLFLEVRVSNSPARTLYEKEGWGYMGLRPDYYRDGEDAALYRRDL